MILTGGSTGWLRSVWTLGRVGDAEFDVFGVADRFAQERCNVLVVEGVVDVAAGSAADDKAEVAQEAELVADGGLFHLGALG